jgi:hypothetical protein
MSSGVSVHPTPVRPPQPAQPVLVRVLLTVVLIALPLLLLWWWSLQSAARHGQDQLAILLAETEASDPRWRWEQIEEDRPAIPDDQNSWVVIERIGPAPSIAILHSNMPRPEGLLLEPSAPNRLLPLPAEGELVLLPPQQARRRQLAVTLKDFPRGRFPLQLRPDVVSTLVPHVDTARHVVELLEIENDHQAIWNRPHRAAETIRAMLHTGALLRDEPFLVCQLARMSFRGRVVRRVERLLGLTEPDEATLLTLQKHLEAEAAEDPLLVGLRGERAVWTLLFERIQSGRVSITDVLKYAPGGADAAGWAPLSGFIYSHQLANDQALMLQSVNRAIEIARGPPEQQLPAWHLLEEAIQTAARIARSDQRFLFAPLLVSSLERVGGAGLRDRTLLRCGIAALAAERFRRAHQDWPRTLADLVPAYLPAVLTDPYLGPPLICKRFPDGLAIYSVGRDGVDDGGEILAPRTPDVANADLGVRLYDPPFRRLPPGQPPEASEPVGPPPPLPERLP